MSSKFYHYFDYENWKDHRDRLLAYMEEKNTKKEAWFGLSDEEFHDDLSDIIEDYRKLGVYLKQIIFISFPPTDLSCTDKNDPRTIFIHIDSQDDEEHLSKDGLSTLFSPKYVLNVPLKNCEKSTTFFYDIIDPDNHKSDQHVWGGGCVDYDNVVEAERLTLDRPAFLKVDVPHAVHNPTEDLRIVCSMRVDDQSPVLKEMFKDE